jgi:hypothetical protein
VKLLRGILLALLASLIAGLVLGTILRLRLEREPDRYFVGQTGRGDRAIAVDQRRLQGTSSTPARLFSARARTKSRSDRRFR